MLTKWTDSLAWDNWYIWKELMFSFSEAKAVSCENLELGMRTHILMEKGAKVFITQVWQDWKNSIEFILWNTRYQVDEIIIRRVVEYKNKDGEILYTWNSRVENFLPIWFEQVKN
jgi:hypothetical protein